MVARLELLELELELRRVDPEDGLVSELEVLLVSRPRKPVLGENFVPQQPFSDAIGVAEFTSGIAAPVVLMYRREASSERTAKR